MKKDIKESIKSVQEELNIVNSELNKLLLEWQEKERTNKDKELNNRIYFCALKVINALSHLPKKILIASDLYNIISQERYFIRDSYFRSINKVFNLKIVMCKEQSGSGFGCLLTYNFNEKVTSLLYSLIKENLDGNQSDIKEIEEELGEINGD